MVATRARYPKVFNSWQPDTQRPLRVVRRRDKDSAAATVARNTLVGLYCQQRITGKAISRSAHTRTSLQAVVRAAAERGANVEPRGRVRCRARAGPSLLLAVWFTVLRYVGMSCRKQAQEAGSEGVRVRVRVCERGCVSVQACIWESVCVRVCVCEAPAVEITASMKRASTTI